MPIQYQADGTEGVGEVLFILDTDPSITRIIKPGWTNESLTAAQLEFFKPLFDQQAQERAAEAK